jgi:hypothetical protein
MVQRLRRVVMVFISPRVQVWVNGINFLRWLMLLPLGMALWSKSLPFLVFVSLDTALIAAFGNWLTSLAALIADPRDPFPNREDDDQ